MSSPQLHRSDFLRRLKKRFPEMKERLRGANQRIHTEVSEFRAFTQEAIDRADQTLVENCFRFADESLAKANRALQNALVVSYLEDLDFQGRPRAFALRLLTPRLAAEREAVLEYLEAITGSRKWSGEGPATPVAKAKRRKHGDAA